MANLVEQIEQLAGQIADDIKAIFSQLNGDREKKSSSVIVVDADGAEIILSKKVTWSEFGTLVYVQFEVFNLNLASLKQNGNIYFKASGLPRAAKRCQLNVSSNDLTFSGELTAEIKNDNIYIKEVTTGQTSSIVNVSQCQGADIYISGTYLK